jgi:hypothetical protein
LIFLLIGKDKVASLPGIGMLGLAAALAQNQYIMLGTFDLRATAKHWVWSPPGFQMGGATPKIAQTGATSLATGARVDSYDGSYMTFQVAFTDKDEADAKETDIALFVRNQNWYYSVWGIVLKPITISNSPMDYTFYQYEVICYLYSPYTYYTPPHTWRGNNCSLPKDSSLIANLGHYDAPFESLRVTCHWTALGGHVEDLALTVGDQSLTLADIALSEEIWELKADNSLLETYEDLITSITQFNQDTTRTGTPTYSGGEILLNNAAAAYYKLSGPNQAKRPIRMTADLSLDSGGAAGLAYVEISSDGISWATALTQADFETGAVEYVLPDTEYLTDIYVRFRNASGTTGKYLRVKSIKFEVTRWVEDDALPLFPLGHSRAAILGGDANSSVDILAKFRSVQHLI